MDEKEIPKANVVKLFVGNYRKKEERDCLLNACAILDDWICQMANCYGISLSAFRSGCLLQNLVFLLNSIRGVNVPSSEKILEGDTIEQVSDESFELIDSVDSNPPIIETRRKSNIGAFIHRFLPS
jgi:hypothetical protein